MPDLSVRSLEPEWMDNDGVDFATFESVLAGLATVNSWTLARPPTLAWLNRATRDWQPGREFTLIDVGSGQGDMLRAIHRWAIRRGLVPKLTGIDLSPWSAPAATAATPAGMDIRFLTGDVFAYAPPEPPDFIISSLVAHHMTDPMLVDFLRWMQTTATRGWLVNDLHRHSLAYWGFGLLAQVMRWHPYIRHDGMLSVARSFRRADWDRLIDKAGLNRSDTTVEWKLPFRLCVGQIR